MTRRVASLVVAVLLVTSALPLGPIGTAVAAPDYSEECTNASITDMAFVIGALGTAYDCAQALSGSDTVAEDLNATDATETKTELYGALSSVDASARTANDTRANALSGTETIARMEAKNAYIRALDNGSSEASARLAAHQAAQDFYARMELQTLKQWEVQVEELHRAWNHSENTTSLTARQFITGDSHWTGADSWNTYWHPPRFDQTTSVTLSNGSTREVPAITVRIEATSGGYNSDSVHSAVIGPETTGNVHVATITSNNYDIYWDGDITVEKPYSEYSGDPVVYHNTKNNGYATQLEQIDQQRQTVEADINDYINGTYSDWEAGTINSSDLVDPYLSAREYGPDGDYQTWALRSLMSMGHASPQDISEFGTMNVTDLSTGETHTGILLSDGLPESGSFTVGNTYSAENLTGPQFVVTSNQSSELEGSFRVEDATNASGGNLTTVDYETTNYRTTNLTEYKQKMEDIRVAQAEIEARQQRLRNSLNDGLGFGGLFGGDSVSQTVALLVIAALLGAALLN